MDTTCFRTISLDKMSQVKLMDRIDYKYWFRTDMLQEILNSVRDDYYVMEIDLETTLPYYSQYFDTQEDDMYLRHHSGKANRYKIRRRLYLSSGIGFLEIKYKTSKGRTIKCRVPSESTGAYFSQAEHKFIEANTPYTGDKLLAGLSNEYSRITLVSKNMTERCTIDLQLKFAHGNSEVSLSKLAIIEIKADKCSSQSPMIKALREKRLLASGFSKYCIGRSLTDGALKANAFKPKLRELHKICK